MGKYIQSPGIDHDEKEYKKYIHIYTHTYIHTHRVTSLYSKNWHDCKLPILYKKIFLL